MKKLLPVLLILPLLLTGCGTVAAFKQPFVARTNAVPTVITVPGQTNTVAQVVAATTNVVGNVVTITPPFVTNLVTITPAAFVTNWSTNVVFEVNPGVQGALSTLETVNKFNPTPTGPFVDLALAGAAGVLGFIARLKTKQAAANANLAQTLVLGIEEAKSAETKASVKKVSEKLGNAPAVNALVQKVTGRFG